MNNIIFLGDSITDAFHNMDGANSLGRGYVRRIADRLYDDGYKGEIRNAGHDGFTTARVLRMLEYDCLRHQPDLVSVLVGCNDAGICMNTGKTLKEQGFQQNYEELLRRLTYETKASVVCMGPFIFPFPEEYANWIPTIREAENIERRAAEKYGAVFLPLHDRLNEVAREIGYYAVTTDGIHLTERGAHIVADEWIHCIDFLPCQLHG